MYWFPPMRIAQSGKAATTGGMPSAISRSSLSGTFSYESGNQTTTGGASVQEYYASLGYSLAPNTTLSLNYFNLQLAGAANGGSSIFYRVQLTYSY